MQLNLNNIIDIHKKISNNVKWTETSFSNSISEKLGIDVFFKFENRQFTGAFKVRGSYSKLLSLNEHEKKSGVVAMSAGNHAQGLAFISKKLNVKSNIVMPEGTPFTKIRRTKNFGGIVKLKFKYIYGLYKNNFSKLYVSSGSGCWGPRLRLGSSNEIVNIRLKKIL
jgi:threonine dehydratase